MGLGWWRFETALEGAGHVGDKAIANFLIEKVYQFFCIDHAWENRTGESFYRRYPAFLKQEARMVLHSCITPNVVMMQRILEYFQSKGLKETKFNLY